MSLLLYHTPSYVYETENITQMSDKSVMKLQLSTALHEGMC